MGRMVDSRGDCVFSLLYSNERPASGRKRSVRPKAEKPVHVAWGSAFLVAALAWIVI